MKNYETFGQVLTRLLRDKKYTIKDLTNEMHLKSTNTIARLLADKSSTKKVASFCDELIKLNPMQLVEYEKEQLREAVEINLVGLDTYLAQKQMLFFVHERAQSPACTCRKAFGENSFFISTLDDLFKSYVEFDTVSITLQNCSLGGVTRALKLLLEHCKDTNCFIEHYLNTNENRFEEVCNFVNLLDVMGHPNYNFYFSEYCNKSGDDFFYVHDNVITTLKCDHEGNKFTDIITFHSEDSFTVLYNTPGEACYQFHLYQSQALRDLHNPAKAVQSNRFSLTGMLDYNKTLLELDQEYPLFSVRPDISQSMLSPEIIQSTTYKLKDQNTDQTFLTQYKKVMEQRYQIFSTSKKKQIYCFSKSGIYYFLKHGKSKANVLGLENLSLEERKEVIRTIIKVGENMQTTTFHLLKNEVNYNNTAYLLYGINTLFINNYPGFLNYNPIRNCHSCWIHSKNIIDNFHYFSENELIKNYVHSNEDTLSFLKSLLHC